MRRALCWCIQDSSWGHRDECHLASVYRRYFSAWPQTTCLNVIVYNSSLVAVQRIGVTVRCWTCDGSCSIDSRLLHFYVTANCWNARASVTKQYNLYLPKGGDALWLGMASHWPCVTDSTRPVNSASGNARPSTQCWWVWKPVTSQLGPLTLAVNSGSGNRALLEQPLDFYEPDVLPGLFSKTLTRKQKVNKIRLHCYDKINSVSNNK